MENALRVQNAMGEGWRDEFGISNSLLGVGRGGGVRSDYNLTKPQRDISSAAQVKRIPNKADS